MNPTIICENCYSNKLDDEYHFLLECPALNDIRKNDYIKNNLKFEQLGLMSTLSYQKQILIVRFIKEGFGIYN